MFYLHSHTGPHTFIIIEVLCGLQGLGGWGKRERQEREEQEKGRRKGKCSNADGSGDVDCDGCHLFPFCVNVSRPSALEQKAESEAQTEAGAGAGDGRRRHRRRRGAGKVW